MCVSSKLNPLLLRQEKRVSISHRNAYVFIAKPGLLSVAKIKISPSNRRKMFFNNVFTTSERILTENDD